MNRKKVQPTLHSFFRSKKGNSTQATMLSSKKIKQKKQYDDTSDIEIIYDSAVKSDPEKHNFIKKEESHNKKSTDLSNSPCLSLNMGVSKSAIEIGIKKEEPHNKENTDLSNSPCLSLNMDELKSEIEIDSTFDFKTEEPHYKENTEFSNSPCLSLNMVELKSEIEIDSTFDFKTEDPYNKESTGSSNSPGLSLNMDELKSEIEIDATFDFKTEDPYNKESTDSSNSPGLLLNMTESKSDIGMDLHPQRLRPIEPDEQCIKQASAPSNNPQGARKRKSGSEITNPSLKRQALMSPSKEASLSNTSGSNSNFAFEIDKIILSNIINIVMNGPLEINPHNRALGERPMTQFENIIRDDDLAFALKFEALNDNAKVLYMRMFFRKRDWHRLSSIKYDDLNNIEFSLNVLKNQGFCDTDTSNCEPRNLLNLLKRAEVIELAKSCLYAKQTQKETLIDLLLNESKNQRSAMDMFSGSGKSTRLKLILKKAREISGPCFKLSEGGINAISRFILLFSMFHDVDEESKRATTQRFLLYNVLTNKISFMDYPICPLAVFVCSEDFLEYERALEVRSRMESAFSDKLYEQFSTCAKESLVALKRLLADQEFCGRLNNLPNYLKRYSAGSVYSSNLTKYCEHFKTLSDTQEICDILNFLIDQQIFGVGARGKWYELLGQLYQKVKMPAEAAQVILCSKNEAHLSEVCRLTLQMKGQLLLKSKTHAKKLDALRNSLDDYCTILVREPSSIEINATAVGENVKGSRLLYEQTTSGGKQYGSVEEQAILYYKENGFTEGIHCEGHIVSSIFFFLFFDLIYNVNTPGVFQSPFQTRPLDFYSSAFYENRKSGIDSRLSEMLAWTREDIKIRVEDIFAQHYETSCVINWTDYLTADLICTVIDCIGIPILQKICRRFALSPRIARSGFPDLTLWNPEAKKCKFVEVKSPNDRLSAKQRVWMDFLRNVGAECEVCNVKNVAGKAKRLSRPTED